MSIFSPTISITITYLETCGWINRYIPEMSVAAMRSERGWGRGSASSAPAGPRVGHRAARASVPTGAAGGHLPQNLLCSGGRCGGQRKGGGRREGRPQGPRASGRGLGGPRGPGALSTRIAPFDLAEPVLPALVVFSRKGSPSWVWVPPASSPAPPTRSELSPSPRPPPPGCPSLQSTGSV